MQPSNSRLLVLSSLAAALASLSVASCRQTAHDTSTDSISESARRLAVATDYRSWGPVDGHIRRAPTDCRGPVSVGARLSAASGQDAHAEKLYRLYARDPAAYLGVESGVSQVGQVLVKEAFELVPYEMPGPGRVPEGVVQLADGSLARLGAPAGLFVMTHVGNGEGEAAWTYGTVAPDGTWTADGRIARCIACHRAAPYDGLFGLDTSARVFAR